MKRIAPLLVVAAALTVAACGGSEPADEATPTTDPREIAYIETMDQVAVRTQEDWDEEHVLAVGYAICERLAAGDVATSDVLPWVISEYGAEDSAAVAAATQAPRHLCAEG
ncbi:DUF732 domain-containing protein [Cellulomonas sp.]|uniref:DUF732 domain-containing protein n=1 Tax=Cellulomonas sp. TaxID=40001 RepID=UPI002810D863|nr:DUF732 domain-containing protein [Cellulomonas sp.]